jgi:hypothetical protein
MKSDEAIAASPEWTDVCSLSASELRERIAMVRAEVLPHVIESGRRADGFAWEFAETAEMRQKLERLVALEGQCCRGEVRWALEAPGDARRLCLVLSGIDPDSKLLDRLVGKPVEPSFGARALGWAKAGGLGIALSFFVFCVLPLAVAAFGGAALAASVARLDDPLVVAGGAVAFAAGAWLWMRRRALRL